MTRHISRFARFIKKEGRTILVAALGLVLFVAIFPVSDNLVRVAVQHSLNSQLNAIRASLRQEQSYALQQAKEMTGPGALASAIEADNVSSTQAALAQEEQQRSLTMTVAVDKNGVALARLPVSSRNGDYVMQTQPWGRATAQGRSVVTFGIGRTLPLVLVAASPIMNNGSVAGAVFAGYNLDDSYAVRFRQQYLGSGMQLGFYSRARGMVANSFQDRATSRLLDAYFNTASDWVQGGSDDLGRVYSLNGRDYAIGNIVFDGLDGSPGGMLVFLPYPLQLQNALFAVVVLVLFGMFTVLFLTEHRHKVMVQLLVLFGFFAVLALAFSIHNSIWQRHVIPIGAPPYVIYNSTLRFDPENDVLTGKNPDRINIQLSSGGEPVNAVEAVVDYDPEQVRVEDIVTDTSICSPAFFLERAVDNVRGQARVACGVPSPGFSGNAGTVATLVVQPLKEGDFTLSFGSSTQVLADDGLGTDVLRQAPGASYRVLSPEHLTDSNGLPIIQPFSSSHPNSARWYNSPEVHIYWPAEDGVSYAYSLDRSSSTVPDGSRVTTSTNLILTAADGDGVYYFHVAALKGSSIGRVSHLKIMIDTTPPPPPKIEASETMPHRGDVVRFRFSGGDDQSGLQPNFYIRFDDGVLLPVLPQLFVPFIDSGVHVVTLRVFDNAGNYSESKLRIVVQ